MKSNLENKVVKILDDAVSIAKEHPVRSAIAALIVIWIIKNLINAVRGN